jgi:hypothetical protein
MFKFDWLITQPNIVRARKKYWKIKKYQYGNH